MNTASTKSIRYLVQAAVIAAIYAVLTLLASSLNLAYGPVQFRISEFLTVLPMFTPAAIPGLTLGCFLANLASPFGPVDWIFGSVATLLAAVVSYLLRNVRIKDIPFLVPMAPVLFNALVVGVELACFSDVGFGFQNLIAARMDSWEKVLFALFIVWATDIGAYLFGRQFGQNKLLSKVSPNKTIEGSVGGILSAIIVALIFGLINHGVYAPHSFFWLLICTILFSIFGQFGDLVESAIKRHFGVKDSGNLIPGHGGILDRCDSWIFVFPIMHFLGLF